MLMCAMFLHHNDIIFLFVTNYHSMRVVFRGHAYTMYILKLLPTSFECLNQHLPELMAIGPRYPMTTIMAAKWQPSISIHSILIGLLFSR